MIRASPEVIRAPALAAHRALDATRSEPTPTQSRSSRNGYGNWPTRSLIREIVARATSATGGLSINRVGVLYDALVEIFEDADKLADSDLRPHTADVSQAAPSDWQLGFGSLLVRAVDTRDEAVEALRLIGEQGEGSGSPPPGESSHFDKFLQIYLAFPEPGRWVPTAPVPTNPNTLSHPSPDPAVERGRIAHPAARLWAHLFNVRYRMLLVDLAHALHLSGPLIDGGTPTVRGRLRDWTFLQMRGRPLGGLRGIAKILTKLPRKDMSEPDPMRAGPPFELPYTFALPDNERDRWRLHLAMLNTSQELVDRITAVGGPAVPGADALLAELAATDQQARAIVTAQLAATKASGQP
ncbi:ferritin-like domain-containing protein [Actinomycetes bacterium KLBMP 9797]